MLQDACIKLTRIIIIRGNIDVIRITTIDINSNLDYLKLLSSNSVWIDMVIDDYFADVDAESIIEFLDVVPDEYIDGTVFDFLINGVSSNCKKIEVEYPYYDNDYLSAYYSHYSRKFRQYDKKCYRIHFFDKKSAYRGFIVLRPIWGGSKIGRSYLSADLFGTSVKYILKAPFCAHVCGEKRNFESFPWKHQETDVAACAHAAIWNVLKYYGNKYSNYRDTNIGEIVDVVEETEGRKTPTKGLSPIQTSHILKEYGFSPVIINQNKESVIDFKEELLAYVESGFPIIAFLNNRGEEHAITIIGHGDIDYEFIQNCDVTTYISSASAIDDLIVMDDNLSPYRIMPFLLATKESEVPYCATHVQYYVVPLYDKVQLEYRFVKTRLNDWLQHDIMNWQDKSIYRIYITSSKSLKEKALDDETMDSDLKEIILSLSMPKFVWCVDFSTLKEYKNQKCSGRIIIDSTSENYYSEPWIFRHDDSEIEYKDYDENAFTIIKKARKNNNPYKMYKNNLKESGHEIP